MNAHDFIVTQVERILLSEGFSAPVANKSSLDALEYYKSNSHFKRSAIDDCIKHARKKAKALENSRKHK